MRTRALLLVAVVACCLGGCREFAQLWLEKATLYADTRTTDKDGFTNKSPQYAYEGEEVTLDFQADLGATDYAVFIWPDGKPDLLTRADLVKTYFRGVGVFKAGREPRSNIIRTVAYNERGERDWFYDDDTKQWVYHQIQGDEPDFEVGRAQMEIICYRVDIDIPFQGGERQVKDIALEIIREDGSRTTRRIKVLDDEPGFRLDGPDTKGVFHVRYTPTAKEVNRTGTTDVKLVLTYDDGSKKTIATTIDTP